MHWRVHTEGTVRSYRLDFIDQGPGIADVEAAMADGFSTRRGLGRGLAGASRMFDEIDIRGGRQGRGTHVRAVLWLP